VIDLLLLYGGDVEKFAGDSMIVVFIPTEQEAAGAGNVMSVKYVYSSDF
jgi:hypothetical protein